MYGLVRSLLFALSPASAHSIGVLALAPCEYVAPVRAIARGLHFPSDPRLRTRVLGLDFPSPVGLAAGFDKNATRGRALASLGFGHIELGTVTAEAQEPNPAPNLFRLPKDRALVNRLGFPNEGATRVCARIRARGGARAIGVPVGVSIGKSRSVPIEPLAGAIDDYRKSFREARTVADFVVINVSSPNTKELRAMQGARIARALFSELVRDNDDGGRKVPLLVKIAPDLSDDELESLLAVVDETKLAGVVATNTTIARTGLVTPPDEVLAIGAGGLSGPPLHARALEMVRRVRGRLGRDVTVIGVGGIETAEDALAMIRAGANLVQLYTGFIYGGPLTACSIGRGLARAAEKAGVKSIGELVGEGADESGAVRS